MIEKTGTYALFGNPVGHSLSPLMHNAAFRLMGINSRYHAIQVRSPREAVETIKQSCIDGASITIPFKTGVMSYLDGISPDALAVGAVNTIKREKETLQGYNTDWQGFIADLREAGLEMEGKMFAVLGAGGAARSVVYGLLHEGGIPSVFNRGQDKGKALAREFGCIFQSLDNIDKTGAEVLVNTTPVGMHPLADESPVEKALLSRFEWVIDLIYNPLETKLLREAGESGCNVRSGLGMLVRQGAEQFRLWTGMEAPVEEMRKVVETELRRRAPK